MAVNITPCVAAAEASAASSRMMQPARHTVRCRSKRIANSAALAQRQRPRLSAPAQAPTRRCTRCGAAGRAAASRQQSCRALAPRRQTRGCHRRQSFEQTLGRHQARERGVQCRRRGRAAAWDDCDITRSERKRERVGEGVNAERRAEEARTLEGVRLNFNSRQAAPLLMDFVRGLHPSIRTEI
jgi:hypothetical protein